MPKTPPRPSSKPPDNRVERFMVWAKGNRFVAGVLVAGLIASGLAAFGESARKIYAAATDLLAAAKGPSADALAAQQQAGQTAALIDRYFAQAIAQPTLDFRSPVDADYERMRSALRKLRIAFEAAKQPERARLAEAGIELIRKVSPYGIFDVDKWQVATLQEQRDEWRLLFHAMGVDLDAGTAAGGGPAASR